MQIIKLDGYNATTDNGKKLELGTFDSYGEEQLQIVKAQNWENLSVIATFNPPNKKPVQVVVDSVTGVIKVPKEATADLYGIGTIVFVGLSDGVQRISADVEYIVRKHSNANGTEPAEPTPSVVEQILTEAQNANTNSAEAKKLATDAKDIAQSVRSDADNGKFNGKDGKDGAKGDKGETGTTPQLKIGEDNLWQVSYDNGATWVSLGVKATGATGEDGADGLTPYIGENGNWWLGDTDTGVSAKGPKGDPGPNDLVIVTYENGKLSKTYDELLADINANKIVAIKDVGNPKFPYYLYSYPDSTYGLFFAASPRLLAKPQQRMLLPFIGVKSDNTITANLSINSGTVPSGGTAGQVLAKKSDTSYVVEWVDMPDVSQLEEDVTKLKEDTTALQKRQNVLVGSETGNPASCNDAFAAPLCGLTVYGKSTQDGTPSPDNPVPIVSAGDDGSVAVKVTGKNLFPVITKANISKINKPTGGVRYGYVFYVPAQSSVTASGNADIGTNCFVGDFDIKTQTYTQKAQLVSEKGGTYTAKLQSGWYVIYIANDYLPTILTKLNAAKIQLEIGTKATVYEPYREQLLTLPTPNGLPGIPVTSGGNYTDQNGQQWICDEVDLERGVRVQRIDKSAFDSTKTLVEQNATLATPIETPLTPAEISAYKALTAYAPDTVVQASDGAGIRLGYQRDVNLVVKNLEDAIASMTTT